MVRDPRRQARLHGADTDVRPDGGAQPRDLSEGYPGGPVRGLAALRLDLAARPASGAAGCDLPRDSAGRAVQHAVQGAARAHPDEEHRLCRSHRRAPRHGHRDHPRAPDREILAQAGAHGLEPAGRRPRLQLRPRALRLSAAHQARGDGQDEGRDPHRRQYRLGARLRLCRSDGRRVVSHHARDVPDGSVHVLLPEVPPRSGDEAEQVRDPAGRGRDCRGRHGHRRELGRRPGLYLHRRAGHLAHERVHRAGVLRRGAGRDLRRPAHRAVDGHADAHAAGRPDALRLRVARRHAPHLPLSGRPARSVRDGDDRVRPGGAVPDSSLRY